MKVEKSKFVQHRRLV